MVLNDRRGDGICKIEEIQHGAEISIPGKKNALYGEIGRYKIEN